MSAFGISTTHVFGLNNIHRTIVKGTELCERDRKRENMYEHLSNKEFILTYTQRCDHNLPIHTVM